jgi:hypothetical protein
MKFLKSLLLLSSIVGIALAGSGDIEGELSIEKYCGDVKVELECDWEAERSRRVRRGRRGLAHVQVPDSHRVLDIELDDVECHLEVEDDDSEDEFHVELDFPEDFTVQKREADGTDDFFVFVAKIKFDNTDIVGEIEVELAETGNVAVYDDSSISIECPEN